MNHGPEVVGELITLRALHDSDRDALWEGAHDPVTSRLTGLVPAQTREQFEAWIAGVLKRSDRIDYAVTAVDSDELIGHVVLTQMDDAARRADLRMSMLPGHRGRGYGREAVFRVLEVGFAPQPEGLGLHRMGLVVLAVNARAKALYESVGFKEEGVLRDYAQIDGTYTDGIVMSLLEHEFDPANSMYSPRFTAPNH